MSSINDAVATVGNIFDLLCACREILESGCCNDCGKKMDCEYCPKPGQLVRFNCPFYEQEDE